MAVSGVHPDHTEFMKAKQTAAMCYPQHLCLGKVLPCRAPHLSPAAGITHNPHSHCTLLLTLQIQPQHTWITPKCSQLCDLCQECCRDTCWHPCEALLQDSPAAISRSLTVFHSKTTFGSTAYRQKHLESICPSTEPWTLILVPVQLTYFLHSNFSLY